MIQHSYDGKPTVFLIPTPIGNMEDITYRAVRILGEVDVIFAEDTRVTKQLLNYLGINKKLVSNHDYNEVGNIDKVIDYLENDKMVAIVTDRGTPLISDPGFKLVEVASKKGFNVVSLPGPTALIPALTMSGIEAQPFTFVGFLSSKNSQRKEQMKYYSNNKETMIFYESPHRIKTMLTDMLEIFGNRKIALVREISKKFEEVRRGDISAIVDSFEEIKGEIVLVVEGNKEEALYDDITINDHVESYIKKGYTSMDAVKMVAKERGISKNLVYKEYHRGE